MPEACPAMNALQIPTDFDSDPAVQAVIRTFGNDGAGLLFRLWLYVARNGRALGKNGEPLIGWALDKARRPLRLDDMAGDLGVDLDRLVAVLDFCAERGHVDAAKWKKRILVLPWMLDQADEYTRRKLSGYYERQKFGASGMTRLEIFQRDEFTCAYCRRRMGIRSLEVDHKIPRVDGGSDHPSNLTTACRACNRSKGRQLAASDLDSAESIFTDIPVVRGSFSESQVPVEREKISQGSRSKAGTRKRGTKTPPDGYSSTWFDQFWAAWPTGLKAAKKAALRAWFNLGIDERIDRDDLTDRIVAAVKSHAEILGWGTQGGQWPPNPATWLNGERWTDEIERARPTRPVLVKRGNQGGTGAADDEKQDAYASLQKRAVEA